MLAVLSPWLIRNWIVVGQPVLSVHFVGRYLYTSNGPGRMVETSGYVDPRGLDLGPLSGPEAAEDGGQLWQTEGRLAALTTGYLLSDPGGLARRLGGKAVNMWRPTFEVFSYRNLFLLALPYCLLMLLSVGGMVVAFRRRIPCAALAAPLVTMLLLHTLFWAELRNRQYLTPLLYAFGGLLVATVIEARKGSAAPTGRAAAA